jgi:hypothetical protein
MKLINTRQTIMRIGKNHYIKNITVTILFLTFSFRINR